mmetsp:Transcript_29287/g.44292  ORF Transcript_29287/g.44292 Transcript_29287/m.44292 type:complete len:89 (+) Transcript_29287:1052-1318(+)
MHQKEINDRRAHYIKKANEEGNSWEKMKLVVGGWKGCGCIDPITNGSVDDTSSPDGSMPDASINRDVIGSSSLDSWNYMLLQGSAVHG